MWRDCCGQNIRGATREVTSGGTSDSGTQCRLFIRFLHVAEHFDILSADYTQVDIAAGTKVVKDSGPNGILHKQFGRCFVQVLSVTCVETKVIGQQTSH